MTHRRPAAMGMVPMGSGFQMLKSVYKPIRSTKLRQTCTVFSSRPQLNIHQSYNMRNSSASFNATFLLMATLVLFLFAMETSGAPNCDLEVGEPVSPKNCKFGVAMDWCRRAVCSKGPGESCGGRWMQHGTCGAGTYCQCNRCTGCSSVTLECFYGQFC